MGVRIKTRDWLIDTECLSCYNERWSGVEITFTICKDCFLEGINWRRVIKELKHMVELSRKEVIKNLKKNNKKVKS